MKFPIFGAAVAGVLNNDGTEARFVFGNLALSQAAGGGTSQTIPVR